MNKAMILLCIATAGISAYALKIRGDLNSLKEIKAKEIVGMINDRQEMYTKLETATLPEPSGTETSDVLERIEMLRQHIPYQPSPDWIREVITAAEMEIRVLRHPREVKAASYHPNECTRHTR